MQQYTIALGMSNVLGETISASYGKRRRALLENSDGVAEEWTGTPPAVQEEVSMRTVVLPRALPQQPLNGGNQQRRWWSWYASGSSNSSSSGLLQQDMSSNPSKPNGMLSGSNSSAKDERLLRRSIFISATQENLYLVSYQQKSRGMVYGMSMTTTPKAWQLVFDGGPLDAEMKRIVACTSIINMSASVYSQQQKGLVACAYADYQNNIKLFGLNTGNGHAFVDLWRATSLPLVSSPLFNITDLRTELVPVPVDLSGGQLASGFPDLVMGVATGSNSSLRSAHLVGCICAVLPVAPLPTCELGHVCQHGLHDQWHGPVCLG